MRANHCNASNKRFISRTTAFSKVLIVGSLSAFAMTSPFSENLYGDTLTARTTVLANETKTIGSAGNILTVTVPGIFTGNGGAVTVGANGTLDILGDIIFTGNKANGQGGAIYLSTGALLHFDGDIRFVDNNTTGNGGAIGGQSLITISSTSAVGNTLTIQNNHSTGVSADSSGGGAFHASGTVGTNSIGITGNYDAILIDANTASRNGGAFCAVAGNIGIDATVTGNLEITKNTAGRGGALAAYAGAISISGSYNGLIIKGNESLNNHGGAFSTGGINQNITISGSYGSGGIQILSNIANEPTDVVVNGGAFFASGSIDITPDYAGKLSITGNRSKSSGGAFFAGGNITIGGSYGSGDIDIKDNYTGLYGGAFRSNAGNINLNVDTTGTLTIAKNSADGNGGVFHSLKDTNITASNGAIVINDNKAKTRGGAVYSGGVTNITGKIVTITNNKATLGGAIYSSKDFTLTLLDNGIMSATGNTGSGGFLYVVSGDINFDIGNNAVATIGTTATATTADSIVGGTGVSLNKTGAGTLILNSENNGLSGNVNVNGGTLKMTHANALGSGAITVASGATLRTQLTASYTFNRTLAGSGRVEIDLSEKSNVVSFKGTGSAFTGIIALDNNTLDLVQGTDNASVIANATLELGSENKTNISGTVASKGLTLLSGTILNFDMSNALFETNILTLDNSSGEILLKLDFSSIQNYNVNYTLITFDNISDLNGSLDANDFFMVESGGLIDYTLSWNGNSLVYGTTSPIPEPSSYTVFFGVFSIAFSVTLRRRRKA